MSDHTCESFLRSKVDASGLDLAVQDQPFPFHYPEFPTQRYTCPHGVKFWVQPTAAEAARLRALNTTGVN